MEYELNQVEADAEVEGAGDVAKRNHLNIVIIITTIIIIITIITIITIIIMFGWVGVGQQQRHAQLILITITIIIIITAIITIITTIIINWLHHCCHNHNHKGENWSMDDKYTKMEGERSIRAFQDKT